MATTPNGTTDYKNLFDTAFATNPQLGASQFQSGADKKGAEYGAEAKRYLTDTKAYSNPTIPAPAPVVQGAMSPTSPSAIPSAQTDMKKTTAPISPNPTAVTTPTTAATEGAAAGGMAGNIPAPANPAQPTPPKETKVTNALGQESTIIENNKKNLPKNPTIEEADARLKAAEVKNVTAQRATDITGNINKEVNANPDVLKEIQSGNWDAFKSRWNMADPEEAKIVEAYYQARQPKDVNGLYNVLKTGQQIYNPDTIKSAEFARANAKADIFKKFNAMNVPDMLQALKNNELPSEITGDLLMNPNRNYELAKAQYDYYLEHKNINDKNEAIYNAVTGKGGTGTGTDGFDTTSTKISEALAKNGVDESSFTAWLTKNHPDAIENTKKYNQVNKELTDMITQRDNVLKDLKKQYPGTPLSTLMAIASRETDEINESIKTKQNEANQLSADNKFQMELYQTDYKYTQDRAAEDRQFARQKEIALFQQKLEKENIKTSSVDLGDRIDLINSETGEVIKSFNKNEKSGTTKDENIGKTIKLDDGTTLGWNPDTGAYDIEYGGSKKDKEGSPEQQQIVSDILNRLPTQLINSEKEVARRTEQIINALNNGQSVQEIMDRQRGLNITNESQKTFVSKVEPILRGVKDKDTMISVVDAINTGNYQQAVTFLENGVYKQNGVETKTINTISSTMQLGNSLKNRIDELKGKFGPITGKTKSAWSKYIAADPKLQALKADMVNFIVPYRNSISGTSVTAEETKFMEDIIANIADKPDNAKQKVVSTLNKVFTDYNNIRENAGLPKVKDWRSAYDINYRKQIYFPPVKVTAQSKGVSGPVITPKIKPPSAEEEALMK